MSTRQIQVLIANILLAAAMLAAPAFADVPYQRIVRAAENPADWLTYSGNYNAQRYSALNQINRQNVSQLRPLWMYQIKRPGVFEASPIVADGVMYITGPNEVYALDAVSGRQIWAFRTPRTPGILSEAGGGANRGVAVANWGRSSGGSLFGAVEPLTRFSAAQAAGKFDEEIAGVEVKVVADHRNGAEDVGHVTGEVHRRKDASSRATVAVFPCEVRADLDPPSLGVLHAITPLTNV